MSAGGELVGICEDSGTYILIHCVIGFLDQRKRER